MKCAFANGSSGCSDGCYLKACTYGYDDCDGKPENGCEASVLADTKNCGGCGMACGVLAHAKVGCVNGLCGITSCDLGFFDCDGNPKNGCETVVNSDIKNCGKCGAACGMGQVCINGGCTCANCQFNNARSKCVNNMCVFDQCVQGFVDCNNNINDGCEADTTSDSNNCGACGNVCPMNQTCQSGVCKKIACMRIGWKFGNDNWACPQGYRMPTVNEYDFVKSCIQPGDQGMFSNYHDIAVSVGGCNCKWNNNWCGQPSIETINGGRMCGDYNQLQICVSM
jgi:hypothetical protein